MPMPLNPPGLPSSPAQHIKRSRSLANPAKHSQPTLEKQWPILPPPLASNPKKTRTLPPFPCIPNQPTRYSVTLQDRSSQAAITLNTYNTKKAAIYPMYMEGEKISGSVELTIGRSMEIQEVLVSVGDDSLLLSRNHNLDSRMYGVQARGRMCSHGNNSRPFVQVIDNLWAAGILDDEASSKHRSGVSRAKLTGSFHWSFSLILPATILTHSGSQGKETHHQLPPSYTSNDLRSSIQYDIVVIIKGRKEIRRVTYKCLQLIVIDHNHRFTACLRLSYMCLSLGLPLCLPFEHLRTKKAHLCSDRK